MKRGAQPAGGRQLEFFFDYISHNAYIAWSQLPALVEEYDLRIVARPVLFAGLLKHFGQLGPAEIRPKAEWMVRDLIRKAAELGLTLNPPAAHPFNPLLALRVTTLVPAGELQHELISRLFVAAWAHGEDLTDTAVVRGHLDAVGLAADTLLRAASEAGTKKALVEATNEAANAGVFGVPGMRCDGEFFWGYDDFGHLHNYLAGRDTLDPEVLAAWQQVPAGSRRGADPLRNDATHAPRGPKR